MEGKKQHKLKQIFLQGRSKRDPLQKEGILSILKTGRNNFRLKYADELFRRIDADICLEFIKTKYTEHPSIVYRYSHKPANGRDLLPRLLRKNKDDVAQEIIKVESGAASRLIEEVVYGMSCSCFDTEEHAIDAQQKRIDDKISSKGYREAKKYATKMGMYIVRELLYKYDSIATKPEDDGHIEVLLMSGVNWLSRIDLTYGNNGYKRIKYNNV